MEDHEDEDEFVEAAQAKYSEEHEKEVRDAAAEKYKGEHESDDDFIDLAREKYIEEHGEEIRDAAAEQYKEDHREDRDFKLTAARLLADEL